DAYARRGEHGKSRFAAPQPAAPVMQRTRPMCNPQPFTSIPMDTLNRVAGGVAPDLPRRDPIPLLEWPPPRGVLDSLREHPGSGPGYAAYSRPDAPPYDVPDCPGAE